MSLLDSPSSVHSSVVRLDELEDASSAWAQDPAEPAVVGLGQQGHVPMVELSRRLAGSPARLPASASLPIGSSPGVAIASAVAALHRGLVPRTDDSKGHPDVR